MDLQCGAVHDRDGEAEQTVFVGGLPAIVEETRVPKPANPALGMGDSQLDGPPSPVPRILSDWLKHRLDCRPGQHGQIV